MKFEVFDIDPVPKPRQTQAAQWKKTPADERYYHFKDEIKRFKVAIPESGYHVLFVLKMPLSGKYKGKKIIRHSACPKTPDKDNLEKALLDSIFTQDSHIWDGRVSKVWGDAGRIVLITGIETEWIKIFLDDVL